MVGTSLASGSRPLWRLLDRYRIDRALVFRKSGPGPALMHESPARYSDKCYGGTLFRDPGATTEQRLCRIGGPIHGITLVCEEDL